MFPRWFLRCCARGTGAPDPGGKRGSPAAHPTPQLHWRHLNAAPSPPWLRRYARLFVVFCLSSTWRPKGLWIDSPRIKLECLYAPVLTKRPLRPEVWPGWSAKGVYEDPHVEGNKSDIRLRSLSGIKRGKKCESQNQCAPLLWWVTECDLMRSDTVTRTQVITAGFHDKVKCIKSIQIIASVAERRPVQVKEIVWNVSENTNII